MNRLLLILSICLLNCFDVKAQNTDLNFDRMTISYGGDSLIPQRYELVTKSKKVYFITPFASYLHIKGERYRTRVRLDKVKRNNIFKLVANLTWTNIDQNTAQLSKDCYFIINTFRGEKMISTYQISEDSLPIDFQTLYSALSDRK